MQPTFYNLLKFLAEKSNTNAHYSFDGSKQREWMVPLLNGWDGDLDNGNLGKPFDRSSLDAEYANKFLRRDRIKNLMATNIEINYVSALERSFRCRHDTPVGALAKATARKVAHSHNTQGVHAWVVGIVKQLES